MGSTKTKTIEGNFSKEKVEKNIASDTNNVLKRQKNKVRGKKYKEAEKKLDKTKLYPLDEAVSLVKELDIARFNSSIELHLQVKKQDLNAKVSLPHSTGVKKKVEVADENTIKKLKENKIDFDVLLATPDMMSKLVPFARILGPKGLMPNSKNGTLIKSAEEAKKFSVDDINLKTEKKAPLIHTVAGKKDMEDKKVLENLEALINAVGKRQVVKAHLCTSMSPSVKLLVE